MKFRIMIFVFMGFLAGEILFAQTTKKTDLFNLTKALGKHQTALEQYKLRLITKNKTIYGPDLVGISRPLPLKMILSFNSFVPEADMEIGRIEIYNEENVFLHAVDYETPLKLEKRKGVNFFFTLELITKLEHAIR